MNKAYNRINNGEGWKDYPNLESPVNAQNLNKVDTGLDEVDNRVITLDNTKATKIEISPLFEEVSYDKQTGIITFTRKNGATVTIDTPMEKIALNIYYDPVTEMLTLPLIDGTRMEVDLSRLITEYEFVDSDTIAFSIKPDGKVTAIIKEGSIEEKHLQPDYLADIKVEAGKAQTAATNAAKSEVNAKKSENAAKTSQTAAKTSETNAKTSEENADASANAATQKATAAANSAAAAKTSETNSKTSETNAAASKTAAANSATTARNKANAAATSAANADNYAQKSQSYAVGGTGTRENEDSDNSKYYYEQTKRISQSVSGVVPMGTITFDSLGNLDNQKAGYLFNISDSFVSDERFADGGGIFYGAGSNVIFTADKKWDVLAAAMVSGVKGSAETEYRQGFVNLTASNIGALSKNENAVSATKAAQDENGNNIADTYLTKTGDTNNNITSFAQASSRVNIDTGEKQSIIFGKIKKWFADIKNGAFCTVANNLTTTSSKYVLDARQGKILNDKFGGMSFGVDADGNYGYIKAGADTVTPFKSSSADFVWSVYGLSGGINLENTGRVTFTVLNYASSGNVGVYGATSPTDLSNRGHLYGYVSTGAGVNTEQVVETPDMESYPYIVLHPIYSSGWTNNNAINTCKIIA